MPPKSQPAVILCLSGHDPSGGAGIQADIEAIAAQGCHAAPVVTCLTVQDTRNVVELAPVPRELFMRQVRLICQDYNIAAIKIGLLGSPVLAQAVAELLDELPLRDISVPVVLDPVLSAGGGTELAEQQIISEICYLLPKVTVITPNHQEVRRLAGSDNIRSAANHILACGCQAVLVTGADESHGQTVTNQLFQAQRDYKWQYEKLPGVYHGSGCTLAATIAARLALGETLHRALTIAQDYTEQTLRNATALGRGQSIPRRCLPCTD